MGLADGALINSAALAAFIAAKSGAQSVSIGAVARLSGGAIQHNVAVDAVLDGVAQRFVLRSDAPSGVAASRPRSEEFALISEAYRAGVPVAEPLWFCGDASVLGRPFFLMRFVEGTASAHRILKDPALGGDRATLARRIGEALARIHAVPLDAPALAFLRAPEGRPAREFVRESRLYLDSLGEPEPALEWGLRWLEVNAPEPSAPVLAHRDFRTGNIVLDGDGIAAVLDWEFAAPGDPHEDLGWFCAKCWRFGRTDLEAGGIGAREDFYAGYQAASGRSVDPERVRFWEIAAHVRWAVIALQQAQRHFSGAEASLELALTGAIVPELELEIVSATSSVQAHV